MLVYGHNEYILSSIPTLPQQPSGSIDVENIIVWGNIGRTTYIDLHKARVHRYESAVWGPADFSLPVMEIIKDR